jgi:membrane protease YdiL (CAAX protease family)
MLALGVFLIFVYSYAFPDALRRANTMIILLSLVLSICNAVCEEILWRATYMHVFNGQPWFSVVFSSFGFAIWHYAPQAIVQNKHPGGAHSFVAFAFVLGLCYGYVALRQRSILLTTIAHACFDFAGLGAAFYFR